MTQVRVRMYRQGLGDCFLITFDPEGSGVHILIDCGTLGATTTGVSLKKVVEHIRDTTSGHLHALIATHEHQDHVSGFNTGKEIFSGFQVDRVWMAWTENPQDSDAIALKRYERDLGAAAAVAAQALAGLGPIEKERSAAVRDLLGFFSDGKPLLGADKFAETVDQAMKFVSSQFGKPTHLNPGDLIEEDWLPGFRFYVLGPPRDTARISDAGSHTSNELYHFARGLALGAKSMTQPDELNPDGEEEMPFDRRFCHRPDAAALEPARRGYERTGDEWRRIDHEWLRGAESLALQLDNITNNTSLALAIERIADGKVLLFPGDAQQGHWLSWHDSDLKWSVENGQATRTVTAEDLLRETVFYKVGHHGSHNATAKNKGLEKMDRTDELVAFVPVDRAVALKRNPTGSWQMPAFSLYRRLLDKCEGRVVRSDLGWAEDAKKAKNKQVEEGLTGIANAATWRKYRKAQEEAEQEETVKIEKLYVDFFLV